MADDKKPPENQDNLIPFPVERVKKKREVKALAGVAPKKKVTLFVSIAALLVLATMVNQLAFRENRDVANESGYVRDPEAEKQLIAELSNPDNRGPASFGREPSAEDKMRSVDLHSRYQLAHADDGMVVAIELMPNAGVESHAIYLKDRGEFLMNYRRVIAPGYDAVEPIPELDGAAITHESYLLKRGPASVGKAMFTLDRTGAFRSLKVEVSPELKK